MGFGYNCIMGFKNIFLEQIILQCRSARGTAKIRLQFREAELPGPLRISACGDA